VFIIPNYTQIIVITFSENHFSLNPVDKNKICLNVSNQWLTWEKNSRVTVATFKKVAYLSF